MFTVMRQFLQAQYRENEAYDEGEEEDKRIHPYGCCDDDGPGHMQRSWLFRNIIVLEQVLYIFSLDSLYSSLKKAAEWPHKSIRSHCKTINTGFNEYDLVAEELCRKLPNVITIVSAFKDNEYDNQEGDATPCSYLKWWILKVFEEN
ncbi:hypothetical protein C922_00007 [Plasmodium inui San Antonio 1]|uniref:Uncharacterized protein n=1 Tax=Plasmodium inui San Antonio 1 TaxID=1237626 RepID=W7AJX9_9APIC|nr:hypothetical protein C922_00007 [Plasmodium inui San Antonio 1]EUD69144.1 hypothetical protein C922_00007 [Plasmodium inui San Antonio 1]